MVQVLVTATAASGLILQVLGSFGGTIDLHHLGLGKSPPDYAVGKKVKARVLYDVAGSSPPQYALSMREPIKDLKSPDDSTSGVAMQGKYPVGTVLASVKVKRVEPERGLIVEVDPELEGFVHVRIACFDHQIPRLSVTDFEHLR